MNTGTQKVLATMPHQQKGNGAGNGAAVRAENEPMVAAPKQVDRPMSQRLDSRMSEKVTLSRGTLWLIGSVVVILNLAFNYGGAVFGWARDDQSHREKLNMVLEKTATLEARVEANAQESKRSFAEIQKTLHALEIKKSYELGVTDSHGGK